MKASVVIIDYKRKKYILDALQSIKNQKGIDLNDIEVIVVKYYQDEKIDNYIKENFPNHKIINLDPNDPDHYVGRTFSEGIKAASNNLIFLLEDDDMFTENKISRIFEIVKKIKNYDEYLIIHKFIVTDESLKKLEYIERKDGSVVLNINNRIITLKYNNSSIILHVKDKNKLIDYLRKICYVADQALVCYFNKRIIKIDEPLTYYRRHEENVSGSKFDRKKLELELQDYQHIYEKTKCKNQIDGIIIYKIRLNILYNANYKISLKEYMEYLLLFDKSYIRRLLRIILYKLFKNYLKRRYMGKIYITDLNIQNT
ncbi:Glycosyltransferase [Candidatus Nanobsidianus stetteri]|uniref:Glycosyltransferase n=1 Tax=Nanobsidianus stetteri TaxID=1294122 RepID=R1E3U5_NANST|nr:Glycosyltransferase [Candidatus Nanobsidianus stetteri]